MRRLCWAGRGHLDIFIASLAHKELLQEAARCNGGLKLSQEAALLSFSV